MVVFSPVAPSCSSPVLAAPPAATLQVSVLAKSARFRINPIPPPPPPPPPASAEPPLPPEPPPAHILTRTMFPELGLYQVCAPVDVNFVVFIGLAGRLVKNLPSPI